MMIRNRGVLGRFWLGGYLAVQLALGCTPPAKAPAPVATSPEAPKPPVQAPVAAALPQTLPELVSGEIAPVDYREIVQGRVLTLDQSDGYQTLLVEVPTTGLPPELVRSVESSLFARVVGASALAPAALADSETSTLVPASTEPSFRLWLRRPTPTVPGPQPPGVEYASPSEVVADVYTSSGVHEVFDDSGGEVRLEPGYHLRVTARVPERSAAQPKVFAAYLSALGSVEPYSPAALFWGERTFASGRFDMPSSVEGEWTDLMRITTGYDSIESALVTEEKLRAVLAPKAATVPLAALKGPELTRHAWAKMLTQLPGATPVDALASMIPAEFYYVRAKSFGAFQTLMDHVDEIVTPGLRAVEHRRNLLNLGDRYRLELGLPKDDLAKVLGPHLIRSLAVIGSDPMLRQGSDLSLVLEVPDPDTLLNVLALKRAALSQTYPLSETNWSHAGVSVTGYSSADRRVRQQVASFRRGDGKAFVLLSNSQKAATRILDTWVGQHPALANELDFQYMLKRDATVVEDVLVYFGDRFVAEVVSPTQRILDSRRQVAKAELAALGYGSLLFGQLYGRLPASAQELAQKSWFGKSRLKHATGEAIRYDQAAGVGSSWGTPERLTSLIELPVPKKVSEAEQRAYQEFAQGYQNRWGERIDPIALRVKVSDDALDLHLRVLPLVNIDEYQDVVRWSGGGATQRGGSLPGVSAVLAIGAGSPVRDILSGNGRSFLGDKFKLDWLGDWVEVGLADEASLAQFVLNQGRLPEHPSAPPRNQRSELDDAANLPLYVALDVKSSAGAAIVLTLLRQMATDAAPDKLQWGEFAKHGSSSIVRIQVDDFTIYYALTKKQLLVALQPDVIQHLIARFDAEGSVKPSPEVKSTSSQLVVDFAPRSDQAGSLVAQSALRTVAVWLMEKGAQEAGLENPLADLLLTGAPIQGVPGDYEQQALRWLGAIPVTPEGKPYQLTQVGIADPARGSTHAPRWPKLPIPDSAVQRLLESLVAIRAGIAVDREPGEANERSLRTRVQMRMRHREAPKP